MKPPNLCTYLMTLTEFISQYQTLLAALGGAVVTVILTQVITALRSHQGNFLVITRQGESAQITISDAIRSNLQIMYKGNLVEQVIINTLRWSNEGKITIENPEISLIATPRTEGEHPLIGRFLEVQATDPDDATNLLAIPRIAGGTEPMEWTIQIRRPFLNPRRAYKDEIVDMNLISSNELDFSLEGGGPNWSTRFQDATNRRWWVGWVSLVVFFAISLGVLQLIPKEPEPEFARNFIAFVIGGIGGLLAATVERILRPGQ